VRNRFGLLEGSVSAVLNLALAVLKLALGVLLQSAGLISVAVHSLGDVATSLIVIIGFRASQKPPDAEHPFGHARVEQVAALIISVLLMVAGFEIGKEAITELIAGENGGELPELSWGMFLVLSAVLLCKGLLAEFAHGLGRSIDSAALKAHSWHHRADALATGMVIVGLWARSYGIYWLDPAVGVALAGLIIIAAVRTAFGAVSPLLGESAPPEEVEQIRRLGQRMAGIEDVHDLRVQRYGHFHFTTIHIEISDQINVHKMHEITVQLETRILNHFPGECVIHVDPINFEHPLFNKVSNLLREAVIRHPDLVEFHDLSLWSTERTEQGDVEISVQPAAPNDTYEALNGYVMRQIDQSFPDLEFTVRLKVDFSAAPMGDLGSV
jgi:cation diffusion facilitator family transporter